MNKLFTTILSGCLFASFAANVYAYSAESDELDWKAEIKAVETMIDNAKKQKERDDVENIKTFAEIDLKLDNAAIALGILTVGEEGIIVNKPEKKDQVKCYIQQVILRLKARRIYEGALSYAVFLAFKKEKEDAAEVIGAASKFSEKCYKYYSFARSNDMDLSDQLDREYEKCAQRDKEEMNISEGRLSAAINNLKSLLEEAQGKLHRSPTE